nr:MAG TPA: zinc-ribbon containing domain protein [Bacteriophage sp.]
MTIDEAISHAREVAECQKMSARLIEDNAYIPESVDKEAITYGNTICANEHEQLAEWLEELKQYRAIGTPEECRAAVERNNEKTRIIDGITECCGYDFGIDAFQRELSKFCPVCGMKIERSDEE